MTDAERAAIVAALARCLDPFEALAGPVRGVSRALVDADRAGLAVNLWKGVNQVRFSLEAIADAMAQEIGADDQPAPVEPEV